VTRDPRGGDDAGLTLVELIAAMALGSLVLALLATVVVSMSRGVRTVTATTTSAADRRVGLEEMSRMLRVAYRPAGEPSAIVSATATSVSFYALVDRTGGANPPPPVLVTYTFDGTCVRESKTAGRALGTVSPTGELYAWDATPSVDCLLRTSRAPGFTYYSSGALTAASADPVPLTVPPAGLALMSRQSVQSVTVTLNGDAGDADVGAVAVRSKVTLQNVEAESQG
jgi:prepilin-type N-terminal cleavage/methylation domain-containing protein